MKTDQRIRSRSNICCFAVCGLLSLAGSGQAREAPSSRPNVLLFFTDDQRASTIGALGDPQIRTPNLDTLASQGTAFTRAYMMGGMTGATCVPSRAMLHSGRHLFHLRHRGHAFSSENTIIVFAGDSGLAVGQHGLLGKQNLYDDAGVHIPLILAGPHIPKDQRCESLVTSCDIFPTLCDLTHIAAPKSIDGRSMSPLLRDASAEIRDCVYLAYREYQRAVVESRYKLIEYVRIPYEEGFRGTRTTQLFDLRDDPWETTDLADKPAYSFTLQRLQQKLQRLRHEFDDGTETGRRIAPEMHDLYQLFWNNYR